MLPSSPPGWKAREQSSQATASADPPDPVITTPPKGAWADSLWQVGLQPAAPDVFRATGDKNVNKALQLPRADIVVRSRVSSELPLVPSIASGAVDIAATDLDEVRSVVQTFQVDPWDASLLQRYTSITYADAGNPGNAYWNSRFAIGNNPALARMHAWMEDAFPTQSDRFGRSADPTDPPAARVRYEPAPPDYLNVLTDLQGSAGEDALGFQERRADQSMLTQGAVLPRCTEFMVEWSFGEATLVNGAPSDLQWYGTTTDTNFNFTQYNEGNNPHNPFAGSDNALAKNVGRGVPGGYKVLARLIYGPTVPPASQTQTAHFGYFDPLYSPLNAGNPDPLKPTLVPWAWPRLVRITVAMVDERDPLKEERFQWVFELPGTPDPQ
mgnify:CR=1 FL=1